MSMGSSLERPTIGGVRHPTRVVAVAGAAGLLAACTSTPEDPRPGPSASAVQTTPSLASPATPTPTPSPTPRVTTPLVLAVNPTRNVVDVPVASARAFSVDGATNWSALGQSSGPLRIVAAGVGPTAGGPAAQRLASTAEALDAVRADPATIALVPAQAMDPTVRALTVGGVHPLRSPTTYPLEAEATTALGEPVTMTIVGDIMLGRRVGEAMAAAGDLAAPLRPLAERLASADVTVGNLESTLSRDGSPTQGGDSFAADPGVAAGLQLAGFDVLSLANNHVGDWGDTALVQTVEAVRAMGIEPVGAGATLAEARSPVIVERGDTSIGVIGTESIGESPAAGTDQPGTNRLNMPPRTGPLDQAALDRIVADIAALDPLVDVVVVIPHWGTQYTNLPEPSQRAVAEAFAQAGADLIAGGHPHWVQGWEMVGPTTVVHSLGNFVFDMDFMRETQEGVFLEVVIVDGRVAAVEPVPYVIGDDFAPRLATPDQAAPILALMRETSQPPFGPGG